MNYKPPVEIAKNACSVANAKGNLPIKTMAVMGFLAGAYIAFGGFLMTTVTQDSAAFVGVGITKLLAGLVFPVGLMLVVVGGAELFTGNCLMPIGVLSGCVPPQKMIKNLVIVYLTNFAGALTFAWMVYSTGLVNGAVAAAALKVAAAKASIPASQMIFRGILCNWLVVLAVWLSYSAMDIISKYICCLIPTAAFVTMGFEHCIANMYFIPLGIMIEHGDKAAAAAAGIAASQAANLTLGGLFNNLFFVTIGNVIGGAFFVGTLYYFVFSSSLGEAHK